MFNYTKEEWQEFSNQLKEGFTQMVDGFKATCQEEEKSNNDTLFEETTQIVNKIKEYEYTNDDLVDSNSLLFNINEVVRCLTTLDTILVFCRDLNAGCMPELENLSALMLVHGILKYEESTYDKRIVFKNKKKK